MDRIDIPCEMENHLPNVVANKFLEYVAFLENELEKRKSQMDIAQSIHENERACLKAQVEAALDKLKEARQESQNLKDLEDQTKLIVCDMKSDFFETGCLLEEELKRGKALEENVHNLKVELEMKNNLLDHRWRRHEKASRQLENENATLRKKATLGWMLGCLSEAYMLSEPKGTVTTLLRMVRRIQGDLENEDVVANCTNEPLHVKLEHVERELLRLMNCDKAVQQPSTSKNHQLAQNRKEPCFLIAITKACSDCQGTKSEGGEALQESGGGQQEEAGKVGKMQQRQEVDEKSQSAQEEIKTILGRLEASIMQLLQNKQGMATVPERHAAGDSPSPPASGEEQQQLHMQERSIDDLILSKARIPSRSKKDRKVKYPSTTNVKTKPSSHS